MYNIEWNFWKSLDCRAATAEALQEAVIVTDFVISSNRSSLVVLF